MTRTLLIVTSLVVVLSGIIGMRTDVWAEQVQDAITAPGSLTNDTLLEMLKNMGLDPKPLSKGYLIAIKRDTWTFNMQLVLSNDLTKLGFNANLGRIENPDSVTAARWESLLVSNGDIDPSAFYFDEKQKKLYLHRSLDNRGITPSFLRSQIDYFVGNIKSTESLWNFTK